MTPENDREFFLSDYQRWVHSGTVDFDTISSGTISGVTTTTTTDGWEGEPNGPPGANGEWFYLLSDAIDHTELYTYHSEEGDTLYWHPHEETDNEQLWKALGITDSEGNPWLTRPVERTLPDPSEATELNEFIEGLRNKGGNDNG